MFLLPGRSSRIPVTFTRRIRVLGNVPWLIQYYCKALIVASGGAGYMRSPTTWKALWANIWVQRVSPVHKINFLSILCKKNEFMSFEIYEM